MRLTSAWAASSWWRMTGPSARRCARFWAAPDTSTSLATDFQTALGILEAEQPLDLLLVDIVMPDGINGIALSRMARMRRRELKVIYITGYSIPGVEREALGPVLRKPVDNQQLIEEIARVLAE